MIKTLVRNIAPPILYRLGSRLFNKKKPQAKNAAGVATPPAGQAPAGQQEGGKGYNPEWHVIKSGILQGREFFVDTKDGYWQKEIVEGTYDQFFFDYITNIDLKDKVVFEIGAHIGYHAMCFAQLVGEGGKVYAFEPNKFNRERLNLILDKNQDLARRIVLVDKAISNQEGEIEFNFSSSIDNGYSSGSFVKGAHTPFDADTYESIGFEESKVVTVSLDNLPKTGIKDKPDLIKIDVEGAENYVLEGARSTIVNAKPVVLMEIHSIYNMYNAYEFFTLSRYKLKFLKEEYDGRCFIAAIPS